jgi:heavy metal translocating P-type ATPase
MKRLFVWHTRHLPLLRLIRTSLGGAFLLASLILTWTNQADAVPFDLAWFAIVFCGVPIILGALIGLFKDHDVTADLLVSMALVGCLVLQEYAAAGEVAFIMELGTILEDFTSSKAEKGIESLIRMSPLKARLVEAGKEQEIPVEQVRLGAGIKVLPGEEIPIDGVVHEGVSSVDESALTGESLPLTKKPGDRLYSGTLNLSSVLLYKATSLAKDSAFQRIVALAKEQDAKKAKVVKKANTWAAWMVLVSFLTALITCLAYYGATSDFWLGFQRGVTVLVVFCPCAFVLATPTAVMAGIGNLTQHRILVRSGEALERIAECDLVCLDKTGTLTEGKAQVLAFVVLSPNDHSREELLSLAVALEKSSSHPMAAPIIAYGGSSPLALDDLLTIPGEGVQGVYEGHHYFLGQKKHEAIPAEEPFLKEGDSLVELYEDEGVLLGFFALSDTLKAEAKKAITTLKERGFTPVLLTGDREGSAQKVASELGIPLVRSGLLPIGKKDAIAEYQKAGHKCLMGGDGINDALALKEAHASFSMGLKGKEIAIENSDAIFVKDEIGEVPYLLSMAKRTLRKIKVNIIISMSLNIIAVSLSIAGLLDPVSGAIFHNAGSVFVVVNSLLLLFHKDPSPKSVRTH